MSSNKIRQGGKFLSVVIIAGLVAAASVSAQEPLRWKFEKGQALDYKMVQDTTITTTGGPLGPQNVSIRQEMDMKWEFVDVDSEGDALIRQKFDHIKMKMGTPLGAVEFDSSSEQAPQGPAAMLAPLYKALIDATFELRMTPRGEIKDVKIPEQLITALKTGMGAQVMGELATPDGFKKMMSQSALVLPENALQPNEQWSTKMELNNLPGVKQVVETTYRFVGKKDVDGTSFAQFEPSLKMAFEGAGAPKIKEQESSGEILFNSDAGRLHSSKLNQLVTMEQAAGVQTKIDQKISLQVSPSGESSDEPVGEPKN